VVTPAPVPRLLVVVPALDEGARIGGVVEAIRRQVDADVLVVDDGSSDRTGEIAREWGATVLRPERNLGSKARAQNHALPWCEGELVLAVDADTVLAPDYLELVAAAFGDEAVVIAAGAVQTRYDRTVWERGRSVEYLFGFHWNRPIQAAAGSPMVCSGCCSVFRRDDLVGAGGFPERTVVEDMDHTWARQLAGRRAAYVPDAVAWAADPETLAYLRRQVWRWMAGFCQNVRLQGGALVRRRPMLGLWVVLALLEVVTAPVWWATPVVAPMVLSARAGRAALEWWAGTELGFTLPVLVYAARRRRVPIGRVLRNLPCLYAVKAVNIWYAWKAVGVELVLVPLGLARGLSVYEKGRA
jgi:cellulose synthase/poly-beta-1,6-N-acetylglucosamine synthase-like glycosyltransferase